MRVALALEGGGQTVIDLEDYHRMKQERWFLNGDGYVQIRKTTKSMRSRSELLHRIIKGAPPGLHVHHKDDCKTNNWRENLEVLTPAEHGRLHQDEARARTGRGRGVPKRRRATTYGAR